MKKFLVFFCAIFIIAFSVPAFSMTITPMDNATNLAQALVGSGVTISNVTYIGATAASGYFTGGSAAGIGIDTGIVLTSGYASYLNGTSNTSDAISSGNGLGGDANLDTLIPGYDTYDATVLEFDFVSDGTAAYFSYVFGSDEYNEWVDSSYNDVFGFFFGDENVALIPGTSTPVSINNVNNDANSGYYNDNDPGDLGTPTPFAFEYDGFTDVLEAEISGLTPGEVYHLKLAIADAGDTALDSGVFLLAGSFSDVSGGGETSVPEPATMLLLGTGIFGLALVGRKKIKV